MGLIRAAIDTVTGSLADSWLEFIQADNMGPNTIMTKGMQVNRGRRGSNRNGTPDIISNGSKIVVGPNQMMLLMQDGKILDYTAEEGAYEVYLSTEPSMFNGEMKESIQASFDRFRFGGTPGKSQQVYFLNLKEIQGMRFGTRNPLQYFDNFYNAELFLRCHGTYSFKITDPIKFFMEVVPRGAIRMESTDLPEQYTSEFLTALQSAIGQMSVDGIRISTLSSKSLELANYMSNVLDESWNKYRGMEIASVGISSISYDDESKALINMRNKGAMMSDPTIREGFVQSSIAQGLQSAGSNTAGAGQSFMAMGMGMNGAGNFMASASTTNAQQMQAQQASANNWTCSCGNVNSGNFCTSCGSKRPAPQVAQSWTCSCGSVNTGNFCTNCGTKRPVSNDWTCSCGTSNKGNFCTNCGKPKA